MTNLQTADLLAISEQAALASRDVTYSLLDKLTQSIFGCQTETEVADMLLTVACECSQSELGLVLSRDQDGTFRVLSQRGLPAERAQAISYDPTCTLFWQLLLAGEAVRLTDSFDQQIFPDIFADAGLDGLGLSWLYPLAWGGQPRAILLLAQEPVNPAVRHLVARMCQRGSLAWERIETRYELLRLRRQVERQQRNRVEVRKAIHFNEDWNRVLTMLEDRYKQLDEILGTAVERLGVSKGSVMLVDEYSAELVVRAVHGIDGDLAERIRRQEMPTLRLKLGEGVAGKVAQTGRPMMLNQVRDEPLFLEPQLSAVDSILCCPLEVSGLVLGVLNFTNKTNGRRFTREDLKLAMKMASQAARAINNARLYQVAVQEPESGLYNRGYLYQRIHDEASRAKRYQRPLSVLAVSLDRGDLTRVHGAQVASRIEVECVRLLQRAVRETDLVARMSESAIGMILPETDSEGAVCLARRLQEDLRRHPFLGTFELEAAFGICSYPEQAGSGVRVGHRAEFALGVALRSAERVQVYRAPGSAGLKPLPKTQEIAEPVLSPN